jgi:hypothetical protein
VSETDPRESNPNAGGPEGLQGDMGISSERTGPFGDDPAVEGIQGTGSHGSSAESTDGTMSTERQHAEEPAEGSPDIDDSDAGSGSSSTQAPSRTGGSDSAGAADGPEMDHTQQQATQEWRDQQPPADQATSTDTELSDDEPSVDRTVGESNTAEVPSQDFDRTKNPGHSHG